MPEITTTNAPPALEMPSDGVVALLSVVTPVVNPSESRLPYTATVPNTWSETQPTYSFGVAEEKGPRRTMEDAHSYNVDFADIHGQGFFAIFDGHAGKEAADWCGKNFHEYLSHYLLENPTATVPDVYNQTFHEVDRTLSKITEDSEGKMHSGCTAVTAFLRIEDSEGKQAFAKSLPSPSSIAPSFNPVTSPPTESDAATEAPSEVADSTESPDSRTGSSPGGTLKKAFRRMTHSSPHHSPRSHSPTGTLKGGRGLNGGTAAPAQHPPADQTLRRVLYVANAGDARGVLCRGGRAIRLTYDHKGTDKQEAKRIMDSGGFVMSGRVNGVLAVTRSLGDSSMKEFVVGAPYTTETELTDDDEFLILACDGIWDVVDDQQACDLIRAIQNPQEASDLLVKEALRLYTNDNITVMVIRFKPAA
ncbi:hypothetical protein EWM64_g4067 [Hericium alpestre]|uniref:PPM-type phosphatase domain-containing protein n=1 Tax=Hericium alpestre TaxID=135208 RepID=A0A4Z0A0T2_9AGAM|nr:hypothetical protein EWM64_g4067 [Hericium alpestre]